MAGRGLNAVLYIIITGTMEAQIINPAQKTSGNHERFRAGLILGGILVAIVVSVFLVRDARAESRTASLLPDFNSTAKLVAQKFVSMGAETILIPFGISPR